METLYNRLTIKQEGYAVDVVIRNANLADGQTGVDIAIDGGRIAAIGPALAVVAGREIDAEGDLVTAPFVDAHFHMDATLSYGLPRVNASGTLLEGIALWGELKPDLTQQALVERAMQYCDWAVARGLLAIRSHVDVCDDRLLAVEALLDVKRRVAPYLDLQLVAFPQDGVLRSPTAFGNLKRAIAMGVDVVGGIPHFERTMADGAESVRLLCEFAAGQGLRVESCRPPDVASLRMEAGVRLPLSTTAAGRAYLAATPENERAHLIGEIAKKAGDEWPALEISLNESFLEYEEFGFCRTARCLQNTAPTSAGAAHCAWTTVRTFFARQRWHVWAFRTVDINYERKRLGEQCHEMLCPFFSTFDDSRNSHWGR